MKTRIPVLFVCILSFTACAKGPSENDARRSFEEELHQQSHGLIRLVSFAKTNGAITNGIYKMWYTADLEFLDDCCWTGGHSNADHKPFQAGRLDEGLNRDYVNVGEMQLAKKGLHQSISGILYLEKTEGGWSLQAIE
jgi:hypothetical protein